MPTLDGESAPDYPVARSCPYATPELYENFRDQGGLHRVTIWNGDRPHLVTRHEDALATLSEDSLSADVLIEGFPLNSPFQALYEGGVFLRTDNPEHNRIRRMLTREFTVKNAFGMKAEIEQLVDELLDVVLADEGPVDLISSFASPVPGVMISKIVGVPEADREHFTQMVTPLADLSATMEQKLGAGKELTEYFASLVKLKRESPGTDLTSRVLRDFVETGQLTEAELGRILLVLFGAGQETTANMLGLCILALLEHPEQLALLRADPSLAPSAVEELLRYFSIALADPRRVATRDVEIGGCPVRAGEGVMVSLMAANHDPRAFGTDESGPDELDITRNPRNHLAFGYGVHQCLGQNLARAELHVALVRLFERIPTLRLAVPFKELRFHDTALVYGLHTLPVTW
ncbi:cytochrome P450 [Streptomyces sp. NPDC094038]|uniref:cytochrome P450 n=1 Tax=Streptomyces sp. NPDC094038 TaxID=3366055 RepID=UPI0038176EFC